MSTLRGRVTLAAVGAVSTVVLVLAGLLVIAVERDRRAGADLALRRRAQVIAAVYEGAGRRRVSPLATVEGLAGPGDEITVRLLRGDEVLDERAAGGRAPLPGRDGIATLRADGADWRSVTQTLRTGVRLQVATPASDVASPMPLRRRVALLTGLCLGAAALLAWWLTGLALRPLRVLGASAAGVATTSDLRVRVPDRGGTAEVDELAGSLNAMLARLEGSAGRVEQALEASRRFAADAGHELRTPLTAIGANADVLRRNPRLGPAEQRQVLAEIGAEQARLLGLLDALQALARGDAEGTVRREPVDLAELLDEAVEGLRRRHPRVRVAVAAPDDPVALRGSSAGLRLVLANLLENAVKHGAGEDGAVGVRLDAAGGQVVLVVEDDGPGIPPAERDLVFQRFRRGAGARGDGHGLGLALVAQQVGLHGGSIEVGEGTRGGARFTISLPS